jgi:hypothetical protein
VLLLKESIIILLLVETQLTLSKAIQNLIININRTISFKILYYYYFLPSTVWLWISEITPIRYNRSSSSLKSYYKSKCIKKLQLNKSITSDYKLHVALHTRWFRVLFDQSFFQYVKKSNNLFWRVFTWCLFTFLNWKITNCQN